MPKQSDLDALLQGARLAADSQVVKLPYTATGAEKTTTAVRAAFDYAVGNGLIVIKPSDEWPQFLKIDPMEEDFATLDTPDTSEVKMSPDELVIRLNADDQEFLAQVFGVYWVTAPGREDVAKLAKFADRHGLLIDFDA